jgi:hypothetical protein
VVKQKRHRKTVALQGNRTNRTTRSCDSRHFFARRLPFPKNGQCVRNANNETGSEEERKFDSQE